MSGLNISGDKLDMLSKISVMAENLTGAFSLRVDGSPYAKGSSANVTISAKKDLPGIDIRVKDGTVGEKIHIPVILTQSGIKDLVYNDFYIGDNCDIEIVAGCGIHNHGHEDSAHDGIHSFHIGKIALLDSKRRVTVHKTYDPIYTDKSLQCNSICNRTEKSPCSDSK